MPFVLHPALAADTIPVIELAVCRVLLMNDRLYPWMILVPAREHLRDLDEIAEAELPAFTGELRLACAVMRHHFSPHKLNVASLGNQVAQLHIHVIGRFETDAAWPRPVWGAQSREPYAESELVETAAALRASFTRLLATAPHET